MKENRGQALVEFLLIIPVLMFIILACIDVGTIIISKYKLEDQISTITNLYENNSLSDINEFINNNNNLSIDYIKNDRQTTIVLSKKISIITPGLNNILGKKMKIETKRTIFNE